MKTTTTTLVATAAALAVLAAALAFSPARESAAEIWLPTSLESSSLPTSSVASALSVTATPAAIDLGPLRPGLAGKTVELRLANGGAVPIRVTAVATPLHGPEATIRADAVDIRSATGDSSLPILAPGGSITLHVRLDTPSGAEQYLPAGPYSGSIGLLLEEVAS